MRKIWQLLAAASVLAFIVVGPASGKAPHNPDAEGKVPCNETDLTGTQNDGGYVEAEPGVLWPPNHKMQTVTITFDETDDDGDDLSLTITGVGHDQIDAEGNEAPGSGPPNSVKGDDIEIVNGQGSGNDDTGGASATVSVKAERAGTIGAGRNYEIAVTCTNETDGNSDMAVVHVHVPHDQGLGGGNSE